VPEHTNTRNFHPLLRLRAKRPPDSTKNGNDEFTSSHITAETRLGNLKYNSSKSDDELFMAPVDVSAAEVQCRKDVQIVRPISLKASNFLVS
jgi:hypothetical protein